MGDVIFTNDQQSVIDHRDGNLLVSAAAGSGKTAVLVERICQKICDRIDLLDIDRILVVTFTNAAAGEMRERILARINKELDNAKKKQKVDREYVDHLQRQTTLIHRAHISTINAFCLRLLHNYFQEAGLEPDCRMMDDGETKLLRQEALEEVLEEAYLSEDPLFLDCLKHFPNIKNDNDLVEAVLTVDKAADCNPSPERYLLDQMNFCRELTEEEFLEGTAIREMEQFFLAGLNDILQEYDRMISLCNAACGPVHLRQFLQEEKNDLSRVAEFHSAAGLRDVIGEMTFKRLNKKPTKASGINPEDVSEELTDIVVNMRNAAKKWFGDHSKDFTTISFPEMTERNNACVAPMRGLIALTMEFRKRYHEKKMTRHVMDFSDQIHFAIKILSTEDAEGNLVPSPVAEEYREYFDEIMTDEYQDTNLAQETILSLLSAEPVGRANRFMVGDVKQSIYSFNQARPDLFLEKAETYWREDNSDRIELSQNFRSRKEIIDSVNEVFSAIMRKRLCGIEYDLRAQLYYGATYYLPNKGNRTELYLIDKGSLEVEGKAIPKEEAEALLVCQKIRSLINSGFRVQGKDENGEAILRPVRYSDIVLLHRSPSRVVNVFQEVMEAEGIPLYVPSNSGYFAATEVQGLLNFLRVLDNPRQDVPMYGVLSSVFGGFSQEEIALLRVHGGDRKNSCFWDNCQSEKLPPAVLQKAEKLVEEIRDLRQQSLYLTIRELVQFICDRYDYLDYVTALPAGTRRRANVEMLLAKATDYEKTSYYGLHQFIRYMDLLDKYESDFGEADVLDENANVVRMMSMHKSKGLEFPVVFLCGAGHQFNTMDQKRSVAADNTLGLAMKYVDPEKRIKGKNCLFEAVKTRKNKDLLAEEVRIWYVGFTRAKEKLFIIGTRDNAKTELQEALDAPRKSLYFREFHGATCPLDLLLPIIGSTSIVSSAVDLQILKRQDEQQMQEMTDWHELLHNPTHERDETLMKGLLERLQYRYPYGYLKNLYTKTTVSELKMAAMKDKEEASHDSMETEQRTSRVPVFRKDPEKVSGTIRGNAYHRVMELMDFDRVVGAVMGGIPNDFASYTASFDKMALEESLSRFLEEETASYRLSSAYREVIYPGRVMEFLQSELAYRMWCAATRGELFREQPFVIEVPATLVNEEFPAEEYVLVQGIIDAFFVENGEVVLFDYKTDNVDTTETLVIRYAAQLDYYRRAIEMLTGKTVKEKLLYAFHFGEVVLV